MFKSRVSVDTFEETLQSWVMRRRQGYSDITKERWTLLSVTLDKTSVLYIVYYYMNISIYNNAWYLITLTLRSLLAFLIGLVGLFDKSYGH